MSASMSAIACLLVRVGAAETTAAAKADVARVEKRILIESKGDSDWSKR